MTSFGGYYEPHPGCQRAVMDTVELLKAQGHTLVEFGPPDLAEVYRLYLGFISVDEQKGLGECLDRDLYDSAVYALNAMAVINKLPRVIAKGLSQLLSSLTLMPPLGKD